MASKRDAAPMAIRSDPRPFRPTAPTRFGRWLAILAIALPVALAGASGALPGTTSVGALPPIAMTLSQAPNPVEPGSSFSLTGAVTIPCSAAQASTSVQLSKNSGPAWATGTNLPLTLTIPTPCSQDPEVLPFTIHMSIASNAPAFTKAPFDVIATHASDQTDAFAILQPAFRPGIALSLEEDPPSGSPSGTASVPVQVMNTGNGEESVSFAVSSGDGAAGSAPQPVVVPTGAEGASTNTSTVYVSVTLPSTAETLHLNLTANVRSAEQANDSASSSATLTIPLTSTNPKTPGPSAILTIGALGGAGALYAVRSRRALGRSKIRPGRKG
jgi:hypothetical protein